MTTEQEERLGQLMLAQAQREGHKPGLPNIGMSIKMQEQAKIIFAKNGRRHATDLCLEHLRKIAPEEMTCDQLCAVIKMGKEATRDALHKLAGQGHITSRMRIDRLRVRLWRAIDQPASGAPTQ